MRNNSSKMLFVFWTYEERHTNIILRLKELDGTDTLFLTQLDHKIYWDTCLFNTAGMKAAKLMQKQNCYRWYLKSFTQHGKWFCCFPPPTAWFITPLAAYLLFLDCRKSLCSWRHQVTVSVMHLDILFEDAAYRQKLIIFRCYCQLKFWPQKFGSYLSTQDSVLYMTLSLRSTAFSPQIRWKYC